MLINESPIAFRDTYALGRLASRVISDNSPLGRILRACGGPRTLISGLALRCLCGWRNALRGSGLAWAVCLTFVFIILGVISDPCVLCPLNYVGSNGRYLALVGDDGILKLGREPLALNLCNPQDIGGL